MKASWKKRLITIALAAALATAAATPVSSLPPVAASAQAQTTMAPASQPRASYDATIDIENLTGSDSGTGWEFSNGLLTINAEGNYLIQGNKNSTANTILIATDQEVSVTIKDVNIKASDDKSAFDLADTANVTLNLEGNNILKNVGVLAGLHVPDGSSLTITAADETHSLDTADSGIGGNSKYLYGSTQSGETSGTITIEQGTIDASYIGGGSGARGGSGGDGAVTIYNGIISARYIGGGKGEGSGSGSGGNGTVTIYNGIINSSGSIGGGSGCGPGGNGTVTIYNGTISAYQIGGGSGFDGGKGGDSTISISGGSVSAGNYIGSGAGIDSGKGGDSTISVSGGSVSAKTYFGNATGGNGSLTSNSPGTGLVSYDYLGEGMKTQDFTSGVLTDRNKKTCTVLGTHDLPMEQWPNLPMSGYDFTTTEDSSLTIPKEKEFDLSSLTPDNLAISPDTVTVEGTLILPSGTTVEQIKNLGLKGNGSVKIDGSEYSLNGVKHEPNPDQWIHDTTHHWHPCRVDGCDLPQDVSTPESHIFGEWTTTKEPTHTQEGEKERSCICGEKQTESIPKLSGDDSQPDQPSKPSKPSKPDTTPSVTPTPTVTLDTTAVNLGSNQHYQFLVKGNNDTANLNVASSNPNVATVSLADGKDSRGAKYQVNAKSLGTAEIRVTYQGGSAVIKVNVTHTGTITLDTTNYTMPHGGSYTIGVTAQQNGQPLTAQQLQAMITRGQLVIRDSRTGSIVQPLEILPNGNVRITGKNTEGTTHIVFELIKDNQVVSHASVAVTVKDGAAPGGLSTRNYANW